MALGTLILQLAPRSRAACAFRLCRWPDSSASQARARSRPVTAAEGGITAGGLRLGAPSDPWAGPTRGSTLDHSPREIVTRSHSGLEVGSCFYKRKIVNRWICSFVMCGVEFSKGLEGGNFAVYFRNKHFTSFYSIIPLIGVLS